MWHDYRNSVVKTNYSAPVFRVRSMVRIAACLAEVVRWPDERDVLRWLPVTSEIACKINIRSADFVAFWQHGLGLVRVSVCTMILAVGLDSVINAVGSRPCRYACPLPAFPSGQVGYGVCWVIRNCSLYFSTALISQLSQSVSLMM